MFVEKKDAEMSLQECLHADNEQGFQNHYITCYTKSRIMLGDEKRSMSSSVKADFEINGRWRTPVVEEFTEVFCI